MGKASIETLLASLGLDASTLTAEQVLQLGHEVAQLTNETRSSIPRLVEIPDECIVIRPTARAAKLLGITPVRDVSPQPHEWYLNIVWIEGRKNALLMHAATTFPIFVPDVRVTELRGFGTWLRSTIGDALASEALAPDVLGDFTNSDVLVAKPVDRRVLGYMNQSSLYAQHRIEQDGGLASTDIEDLNRWLRRDLHSHDATYASAIEIITGRRR